MSKSTLNMAHCTKCGIRHTQPVRAFCKRNFVVSVPVLTKAQEDNVHNQDHPSEQQERGVTYIPTASGSARDDAVSQVESKQPECKNSRLDQILDEQHPPVSSNTQLSRHA